jgi:hypothetical protein
MDAQNFSSFDSACSPADRVFLRIPVRWSQIEPEDGGYDEAFLANLRKELKARGEDVVLEPIRDKDAGDFTAAVVHLTRRVKDCEKVIGVKGDFRAVLEGKHPHYLYL